MQPGIWTSYLIDASPEEMTERFSESGWFHLELSTEHGAALLERGDPAETGSRFARFAGDLGVSFPQGHLWLTCDITGADSDRILDQLRRWLDLFVGVGVRAGVLHPGGEAMRRNGAEPDAVLDRQVKMLRALCGHLRGSDLVICLENVSGTLEADGLLAILEAVGDDRLGICLDTGHLNLGSGDQAGFIRKAGERLKALHLADNEGQTDQHLMPYGRGTIDWGKVMGALKELPYEGLLNLEIPGENRAPLEVRMAKLDYLKKVMRFMVEKA